MRSSIQRFVPRSSYGWKNLPRKANSVGARSIAKWKKNGKRRRKRELLKYKKKEGERKREKVIGVGKETHAMTAP